MKLYAPEAFVKASEAERRRRCNGCGTKGLGGWLVPDSLYGLDISLACDIHDWMYAEGNTIQNKEEADRVFLNNLLRIIEAESGWLLRPLRRYRAMSYYNAVRDFGGPAYWKGKNQPREWVDSDNEAWDLI